jgi:hypothetical protein
LDAITLAHRRAYDVALVLSQDQDLAEAARAHRWIKTSRRARSSEASTERTGSPLTERCTIGASTDVTTDCVSAPVGSATSWGGARG